MWGDLINYTGTFADQYELAMAEVYFLSDRKDDQAVFDYYFRNLPSHSGYVIFSGLEEILHILETFQFNGDDIRYLEERKMNPSFIEYLKGFRFHGSIYSCQEGEVVFPNEPILRVEGGILETQLVETVLLNVLNFQSLVATKAARIRSVAPDKTLLEFGLRRAQGAGGYNASRAAMVGGFDGTSHVKAAIDLGIGASGTMAHSFIQSEESELEAFRKFARYRPENCVLLLDTYNTLESGLPHAITVAKEMESNGHKLLGIRLDSGDLAYLSKECRRILNESGLSYVKIVASNQLDEFVIDSLNKQKAPIDIFGVGTKLVVGDPDGALDGVYKLSEVNGQPKLKLSESAAKIGLPHKKQIYRILDDHERFLGADAIGLTDEKEMDYIYHPVEAFNRLKVSKRVKIPLLTLQMENGVRLTPPLPIEEIKSFAQGRLKLLPDEYKRFHNPHSYKVGLTSRLKTIRDSLIEEFKKAT